VFAEAARRTRDVIPDGVARSLHAMGEYDMGGFRVNFARNNTGSGFVDIGVVNAEGRLILLTPAQAGLRPPRGCRFR
jgi:hypothetical protein